MTSKATPEERPAEICGHTRLFNRDTQHSNRCAYYCAYCGEGFNVLRPQALRQCRNDMADKIIKLIEDAYDDLGWLVDEIRVLKGDTPEEG